MYNGSNEETLNTKWIILVLVLALGIMSFSIMAKLISKTTYKRHTASMSSEWITEKKTRFADGYDWNAVEKLSMPKMEKSYIKGTLLKLTIEASIINGNPVIKSGAKLGVFVKFIDNLYKNPSNRDIPIYFALKMAEMNAKGSSSRAVEGYKALVMRKLKNLGLIRP